MKNQLINFIPQKCEGIIDQKLLSNRKKNTYN